MIAEIWCVVLKAVAVGFNHPLTAAHLSFDTLQARQLTRHAMLSVVGENSAMKKVANEVNERLQRVIEQI